MGGIFSSGKSAAKRQAEAMRQQMEQDRQQFEQEQARLAQEREAADAQHQSMLAEQRAKENAAKLQAQLQEQNKISAEDDVAEVLPDLNDTGTKKRKRKDLDLSSVLGI